MFIVVFIRVKLYLNKLNLVVLILLEEIYLKCFSLEKFFYSYFKIICFEF